MNGRWTGKAIFLFFLLIVIILLQLLTRIQTNRFLKKLDSLEKKLSSVSTLESSEGQKSPAKEEYPGDEGDWLVWAFPVEPKTLNLISVDTDIYAVWMCFETVFEPLLAYDYDEIKLVPCLAKSYEVSADGLEITLF